MLFCVITYIVDVYISMCICIYLYLGVCMYVFMSVYIEYLYMDTYMNMMCMYEDLCMYLYDYVYICIQIQGFLDWMMDFFEWTEWWIVLVEWRCKTSYLAVSLLEIRQGPHSRLFSQKSTSRAAQILTPRTPRFSIQSVNQRDYREALQFARHKKYFSWRKSANGRIYR